MSNAAKLKKKAAEFEQKKQFDKALQLYVQILDESDGDDGEADVALYNRVGDLLMRQGTVGEAMTYYEKAVDIYAESGFFNNAIALCNKILRQSPGRNSIYYKLGKISAKKGFISDAKQNFLEYASRMQGAGQLDEAFRALKEFADLCPDQDDIRLMLAEQLSKDGRKSEALEQLQLLYQRYDSEGRSSEMSDTLSRMRALDPSAQPRSGGGTSSLKSSELVFIDLSDDGSKSKPPAAPPGPPQTAGKARPAGAAPPSAPPAPPATRPAPAPRSGAPANAVRPAAPAEQPPALDDGATDGAAGVDRDDDLLPLPPGGESEQSISGFMTNEQFAATGAAAPGRVRGFEPSTLDDELNVALNEALPDLDAPLSGRQFASLHLATPLDVPAVIPEHDLALPGELPPLSGVRGQAISLTGEMDLIIPESDAPSPRSPFRPAPRPGPRGAPSGPPAAGGLGAPVRPQPGARPAVPAAGTGPRPLEPTTDLPLLDVDLPAPTDRMQRPTRPRRPGGDDLMLVEGAELLDMGDAPDDQGAFGRGTDEREATTDEAWVAEPLEMPVTDVPVEDDTDGPGYENRIDLPPWMDALAAPNANGSAATTSSPGASPQSTSSPVPDAARHQSRSPLARSADALRTRVEANPNDWALRRTLAEALLDSGDREGGLHELEAAMIGLERAQDLEGARSTADVIIRLNPNSVRHHQKRVEYAFRTSDRTRLPEAYLELADALFRSGQADKARAVYHRVLELAPDDGRAQAALSTFGEVPLSKSAAAGPAGTAKTARPAVHPTSSAGPALAGSWPAFGPASGPSSAEETEDGPVRSSPPSRRSRRSIPAQVHPEHVRPIATEGREPLRIVPDEFVNLGDLVRDDDSPKSTRLVIDEEEPTGDEAADFADMLRRFKQGIAENVDDEDHESHYDLGVAYKEMGLVDEAISQFQKALRGPDHRARTFEALGQCFVEKQQFRVAATILSRALTEPGVTDDQLVGVLYLLGYTSEALMQWEAAISYYQRVFAVDIRFRDAAQRLAALERTAQ